MGDELWIEIVDWHRFQHYRDRQPPWIKNYVELLANRNYLALPAPTAALLHKLWLLYAASHRTIPLDTRYISRTTSQRVTKRQLELLNEAGFIRFSASKPLAPPARAQRREEQELKPFERTLSRAVEHDDVEELLKHVEEQLR